MSLIEAAVPSDGSLRDSWHGGVPRPIDGPPSGAVCATASADWRADGRSPRRVIAIAAKHSPSAGVGGPALRRRSARAVCDSRHDRFRDLGSPALIEAPELRYGVIVTM
jgi:hypothetical protein